MKYLTRKEELILLAVLKLKDRASLVTIREVLKKSTKEEWTVGNVYVALDKLERSGHLLSSVGEPTGKRGGKAVKYYRVTSSGFKALERNKRVQDLMWKEFSTAPQEE